MLLAEDNEINALLARAVLEKVGCQVTQVRNGVEAVQTFHDVSTDTTGPAFDLILMDIHMPDMDGIEATRAIKALCDSGSGDIAGRPPIIALTANAFPEDREQYLEAGLDDYLAKPFEKDELEAVLAKWTEEPIGQVKAEPSLNSA